MVRIDESLRENRDGVSKNRSEYNLTEYLMWQFGDLGAQYLRLEL